MLSKSAAQPAANRLAPQESANLVKLELPEFCQKEEEKQEKLQKIGSANVISTLETLDKHCPGLAPTLTLVKDKKLGVALDATEPRIAAPEVTFKKDGDKLKANKIIISLGLATLPTTNEEKAVLIGAMVKSLTLAESVNTNGKLPATEKENKAFHDKYVENLTAVRDSLIKDGGKEALELAKGMEKVLGGIKKDSK